MNYTKHYQLNQWEPTDRVLREDFNEDNQKIEAALKTIPQLVMGTYTGNGEPTQFIDLGFTPQALYVAASDGMSFRSISGTNQLCGGLVFRGEPALDTYRQRLILEICENGFRVTYNVDVSIYLYANQKDMKYHYIALK